VIECPKCGYLNPEGTEFCQNPKMCGTFVGYTDRKVAPLPGGVVLTVSPASFAVAPGSEVTVEVRIRNKSQIVDQYEIKVVGEPSRWTLAEPPTLSLFPDGEGQAKVRFRPVRSPEEPAGRKPFSILVQSKASASVSAYQDGAVDVAPFQQPTLAIVPRTSRGGTSASHRITVANQGNAPLQASLEGIDPDDLLTFNFDKPSVVVAPGESAYVQLVAQPRATFYDGPPQPHAFKVQLTAAGLAPVTTDATMLQEAVPRPARRKFPLVPVLLGVLLLGLVAAAAIERDPLMQLVAGRTSNPVTGGSTTVPTTAPKATATPTATPTVTVAPTVTVLQVVLCAGQRKLQGTYIFDLESCAQAPMGDLWWEQVDSVTRRLVPRNGATVAVMGRVDYNAVTLEALKSQAYRSTPISGSLPTFNDLTRFNQLTPGTVIAVKTRNGHYAKVRIDTYGYDLLITATTYQ